MSASSVASDVDVVPVAPAVPLSPERQRVIGLLAAFALVNFPDVLVLLRLSDIGWTTAEVVGGYALYNLAYSVVSYPAGRLSDRMPRAHVYALGLVFFAIGYLGLGLLDSGPLVLVVLVLYGGFNGCTDGVGKAWVSSLAPRPRARPGAGRVPGVQRCRHPGRRDSGRVCCGTSAPATACSPCWSAARSRWSSPRPVGRTAAV